MRVALAQINSTVGDLHGNTSKMIDYSRRAAAAGAEVVVFPELSLNGYPPRDLVEKRSFIERTQTELDRLAEATAQLDASIIAGYVGPADASTGKQATNSAAVIEKGRIVFREHKMLLPTYDVFDEARYFAPADRAHIASVRNTPTALTICEDAWNDKQYWQRPLYSRDPVAELASAGMEFLISINASPYHMGKRAQRRDMISQVLISFGRIGSGPLVTMSTVKSSTLRTSLMAEV